MKVRLGDICEVFTDGDWIESKDQSPSGVRLIQTGNIGNGEFLNKATKKRYISDTTFKDLKCTEVFADDILISRLPDPIGRCCIVPNLPERTITAVDCTICRINTSIVNLNYLCCFLQSPKYFNQLEVKITGTTRKRISRKNLGEVQVSLPSLAEQNKIASNIYQITHLISIRKKEYALLDQLVKSRFMEMFGDPVTNNKNWLTSQLSNHIELIGGYAFESSKLNTSDGIPVVKIGNINSGIFKATNLMYSEKLSHLAKYKLFPGDLVISLTGTIGKEDYANICIMGNDYSEYYLNQRNAKIQITNSLEKYYLVSLLRFNQIKRQITNVSRGVRQANVSNKDILTLIIPLPPLPLQQQFADFVEKVDKSKFIVGNRLAGRLYRNLLTKLSLSEADYD